MIQPPRIVHNRNVSAGPQPSAGRAPQEFHRRLPGYEPSRLVHAPGVARELGVGSVLLKDESSRLGLPAFKILGASWAVYRALDERIGGFAPWDSIDDLRSQLEPLGPLILSAATDGNHGRAVARMAKLLGLDATIYVPAGMAQARIDAIAGEGASVIIVDGTYDEAVARSAEDAGERCLVISDTSWPGYENVPRWVSTATRRSSGRSTISSVKAANSLRIWSRSRSGSARWPQPSSRTSVSAASSRRSSASSRCAPPAC